MNVGMFVTGVLVLVGIYSIQTLSLNVKFGELGLIDLGLVGYFAVGAYTYALVTAPPPGLPTRTSSGSAGRSGQVSSSRPS